MRPLLQIDQNKRKESFGKEKEGGGAMSLNVVPVTLEDLDELDSPPSQRNALVYERCPRCGKDFNGLRTLEREKHLVACVEKDSFLCPICDKNITKYNDMRRLNHVNRCLETASENQREEILKQAHQAASLLDDAPSDINGPRYDCSICGKNLDLVDFKARTVHLKGCSRKNGVTPRELNAGTKADPNMSKVLDLKALFALQARRNAPEQRAEAPKPSTAKRTPAPVLEPAAKPVKKPAAPRAPRASRTAQVSGRDDELLLPQSKDDEAMQMALAISMSEHTAKKKEEEMVLVDDRDEMDQDIFETPTPQFPKSRLGSLRSGFPSATQNLWSMHQAMPSQVVSTQLKASQEVDGIDLLLNQLSQESQAHKDVKKEPSRNTQPNPSTKKVIEIDDTPVKPTSKPDPLLLAHLKSPSVLNASSIDQQNSSNPSVPSPHSTQPHRPSIPPFSENAAESPIVRSQMRELEHILDVDDGSDLMSPLQARNLQKTDFVDISSQSQDLLAHRSQSNSSFPKDSKPPTVFKPIQIEDDQDDVEKEIDEKEEKEGILEDVLAQPGTQPSHIFPMSSPDDLPSLESLLGINRNKKKMEEPAIKKKEEKGKEKREVQLLELTSIQRVQIEECVDLMVVHENNSKGADPQEDSDLELEVVKGTKSKDKETGSNRACDRIDKAVEVEKHRLEKIANDEIEAIRRRVQFQVDVLYQDRFDWLKRADDDTSFRERIEFSSAEPFDFEALKSIASPPPTQIVPRTIDTAIRGKTIPEVEEKPAKPLPQSTSMLPRSASRNGNLSGPDPMDIEGLSVDLEPLKTRFSFSSQYLAEPQFSSAAPSKVPSRSNSFASDPAGAKKSETDILAAGIELDEDPLPQVGKKKRPAPSKKRKRVDEEGNERADDLPMDLAAEKEKPNEAEEKEPYEGPDYALMSTEELKGECSKFGIRSASRKFMIAELSRIWTLTNARTSKTLIDAGKALQKGATLSREQSLEVISQLKSKGTKPNGATTVQQPSRPISEVVTKKAKFMMEDEIDEAIGKIIKLDKNAALYREILQYNPIEVSAVQKCLKEEGLNISQPRIGEYLTSKGVVFSKMSTMTTTKSLRPL